ncbi:hypothetical protein LTR56_001729 [Elasticomyces elasticus]|nr:hypothetical protein LTR56_001729 [Elasticomyces elasticus]KAK4932701.1 hypothetical protein LTR49_001125 [Elasticomyces elasticus]KAK5769723.1 hypothetical protein LTS12_000173 [Elasticomyces elasticus]
MPLSARQGSRMPSMPVVSSDYFSERRTIGNGDMSEPVSLNNIEIEIKHPLTAADLPGGLGQRDLLELKVRLEHQNRRVHIDDLVKRAIAARYRARKESIATIDAWLAQEQAVKNSLAEDAANQVEDDTGDLFADIEAGPSDSAKGKRAESFTRRGATNPFMRPNLYSNTSSTRPVHSGSYVPSGSPSRDRPCLAAMIRERERGIVRGDVGHPETPRGPHTETPPAVTQGVEGQGEDSFAEEARAATKLHQKSEQATASTVDLQSNIADDGSDIGNLDDVKSDTTDLATSASLSGSDVKVDTLADDEYEDGKKSPTAS